MEIIGWSVRHKVKVKQESLYLLTIPLKKINTGLTAIMCLAQKSAPQDKLKNV